MKLTEFLNESKSKTMNLGLTQIVIGDKVVSIEHRGNMGDREGDVQKNVNKMLKGDFFKKLKAKGKFYTTKFNVHDDPSYSYILNVPRKDYDKIVGVVTEMVKHASWEEKEIKNAIASLVKQFKDKVEYDPNKSALTLNQLEKMIETVYRAGYFDGGEAVAPYVEK